jgi:hypothetical protein
MFFELRTAFMKRKFCFKRSSSFLGSRKKIRVIQEAGLPVNIIIGPK